MMLSLIATRLPASGPSAAPRIDVRTYHACSGSSSAAGKRNSERGVPHRRPVLRDPSSAS